MFQFVERLLAVFICQLLPLTAFFDLLSRLIECTVIGFAFPRLCVRLNLKPPNKGKFCFQPIICNPGRGRIVFCGYNVFSTFLSLFTCLVAGPQRTEKEQN